MVKKIKKIKPIKEEPINKIPFEDFEKEMMEAEAIRETEENIRLKAENELLKTILEQVLKIELIPKIKNYRSFD
jgi:hypothetical protein